MNAAFMGFQSSSCTVHMYWNRESEVLLKVTSLYEWFSRRGKCGNHC